MNEATPRVTVAFPVYNGERYVGAALEGLLNQTFTDFELVISDNASTDGTEAICRSVAARDPRVRYVRHEVNRGLVWNHQFTLEQARGTYFTWANHDDLHAPAFLERCVAAMDHDPGVVHCNTRISLIDDEGRSIGAISGDFTIDSPFPHERLREVVGLGSHRYRGQQAFGLFRSSALASVPRLSTHVAWDRALLAELSLHGRFIEVPEALFFYRRHAQQASSSFQTRAQLWAWHDPSKANRIVFPNFRLGLDYVEAVARAPLTAPERRRCYAMLARWPVRYWKLLALDVARARPQAAALLARARTAGARHPAREVRAAKDVTGQG
jgi:glycosyltransferase involved in cell wall biosynthesis